MQARQLVRIVSIASILCVAADAHAQFFRSWIDANGGSYGDPFKWSPSGVPNADDGAGFGLDAIYFVTFPGNQTTGIVTVSNGLVGFDMNSSTLTVVGTLTVAGPGFLGIVDGAVDPGSIVVSGGGEFEVDSTAALIAADGATTVTGSGSTWTDENPIFVGESGTGTLNIEAGGSVESTSNGTSIIGFGSTSTGTVTVTGADSTWINDGAHFVGDRGDGTLTVENGGSVTSAYGRIGDNSGSVGFVTVTGAGSTWMTDGGIYVGNISSGIFGNSSSGTLIVSDGGSVSSSVVFNNPALIGAFSGAVGEVTVTGAGSTWTHGGRLRVGENGDGTLTILDGGSVSNTDGIIGFFSSAIGAVAVTDAGSTWALSGRLSIGGDAIFGNGNGGEGTLDINQGGLVEVAEDIVLYPDGLLRLDGGTLIASAVNFDGGGQFDFLSGTLEVDGFTGALLNQGGTLAPGPSAGATTVAGQYAQGAGAVLDIEIGGLSASTEHDFVTVIGDVQLDGGELRLTLLDGFVPNEPDTFTILEADGDLLGQFDNVANGARVDTADGLGSFLVHYGAESVFNPDHIVLSAFGPVCPADIDGSGTVNVVDLLAVLGAWGACEAPCPPACAADTNGDCVVNVVDLLAVLGAWGSCS